MHIDKYLIHITYYSENVKKIKIRIMEMFSFVLVLTYWLCLAIVNIIGLSRSSF